VICDRVAVDLSISHGMWLRLGHVDPFQDYDAPSHFVDLKLWHQTITSQQRHGIYAGLNLIA
jgi:hypothetical protein